MSEVKRYRATIGNGGSQRREWVYLCDDLELPKHENLFKSVSAQSVDALTAAQSELAALREELADAQRVLSFSGNEADAYSTATLHTELEDTQQRLTAAEQRNSELVELLRDIYNQNELSGFDDQRILAVIQPIESGASE